jgi:hypothetical protein
MASAGPADPAGERDEPEAVRSGFDRRRFLRRGAVGLGAAWVAPQIIGVSPVGADTLFYLQIDPNTCDAVVTTSPAVVSGCEPTGWLAGQAAPVNGVDFDWTLVENVPGDCTLGFVITLDSVNATFIEAQAEAVCPSASPPSQMCVPGTFNVDLNEVTFLNIGGPPDDCVYVAFRLLVNLGS